MIWSVRSSSASLRRTKVGPSRPLPWQSMLLSQVIRELATGFHLERDHTCLCRVHRKGPEAAFVPHERAQVIDIKDGAEEKCAG